jgi:hypothetical protein
LEVLAELVVLETQEILETQEPLELQEQAATVVEEVFLGTPTLQDSHQVELVEILADKVVDLVSVVVVVAGPVDLPVEVTVAMVVIPLTSGVVAEEEEGDLMPEVQELQEMQELQEIQLQEMQDLQQIQVLRHQS